ncbi:MAG TPA: YggS family pyridoxal phosphate-dependent enzyme [Candidatus Limnocylindria bacterium]|nr:YggS family pyridoxal phosphate-dependent enzyme [Candidatus Limnocylindria bacterium]
MTPVAEQIAARHTGLVARLRRAAAAAGRDPDGFRIVAVSKGMPVEAVRAARQAGLHRFGENRVQEALAKIAALSEAEWHLVGHLQSNKARAAARAFAMIHSVDSLPLLRRLEKIAHDEGLRPVLLLQVNVTAEASKSGFAAERLASETARPGSELLTLLRQLRHVRVEGLMTIAAADRDARQTFATLRELRDRLSDSLGTLLPELSMGMSGDAEAAVAEGATLVRIGTALFGPRPDHHRPA